MDITLLHSQRGVPAGLLLTNLSGKTDRQIGFSNDADPLGFPAFVTQR